MSGLKRCVRIARLGVVVAMAVAVGCTTFVASAMAEGSFVIGDQNASVGTSVTFWGAQWWKLNSLSGGSAPAAFKGYANTPEGAPACGTPWSTDPGNSSEPPAGPLPEFIEAIVSSEVTKAGRIISGDTLEVVLIQTEPGYAPDPGHAGTGTVVAVVCPSGGGPR